MPVTITKPQATLRELLAGLKKRTGLFGEQVLRANTIDEYYSVRGANRNLIINGDFKISQRGDYTTAANLPSSTYTLDRWISYMSNMTGTLQHTTVTLNGETRRAAKVVLTNSTSGEALLEQRVEPVNMVVGKIYTLSAWVRTTNSSIRLRVHDGGGWIHSPVSQYATPSGQWQKITFTYLYNGPVAGYHPVQLYCSSGNTGEYYEFTDFQLEEGTVATPFERRLIGQELQLCQRYYQKSFAQATTPADGQTGQPESGLFTYDTTAGQSHFTPFIVTMRASPTMTFYQASGRGSTAGQWATYDGSSWTSLTTSIAFSSGLSQNGFTFVGARSSAFTARLPYLLSGHYTASAEL